MVEVTFYDAAGRTVCKTAYGSYQTAWNMVCWLQRNLKGVTVSVRNLKKARAEKIWEKTCVQYCSPGRRVLE